VQKGEHYHIDDGQDAINNIYACGLIEEINIEPEQDMTDPSKINIRVVVEEVQPKSMEVRMLELVSLLRSFISWVCLWLVFVHSAGCCTYSCKVPPGGRQLHSLLP
jgi:hypothetical protein